MLYIVFSDEINLEDWIEHNTDFLVGKKWSVVCRNGYMNCIEFE